MSQCVYLLRVGHHLQNSSWEVGKGGGRKGKRVRISFHPSRQPSPIFACCVQYYDGEAEP